MSTPVEMAADAVARFLYDHNARRSDPCFDHAPEIAQEALRAAAADLVEVAFAAAQPVEPDVEVVKMHLQLLAAELEQVPLILGARAARKIRQALAEATVSN